jgi:type I restriction enzyme S subunit
VNAAWQTKSLGDLCSIDKQQGVYEWLPYVGMEDIESETGRFLGSTEPRSVKSSTFRFTERHILYGRLRPYLNKVLLPDFEGHCSTEIFPLLPNDNTSKAFLRYWLIMEANVVKINETCTGARMPRANVDELLGFELQIPGLKEQERIVAILDEAFEAIATAKANAELSILETRSLLKAYSHSLFSDLAAAWKKRRLGELCTFVRGPFGGTLKKSEFCSGGYAVYEQQHAIYDQFDDIRYFIDEMKFQEMKRFEVHAGDLIMSCSGTMGRVAVAPVGLKRGIINQALLKLTASGAISVRFLKQWMESVHFQESLKGHSQGAAIQNVASVKILKEIMIPLPPIQTQDEAVSKLESFRSETTRLEDVQKQKVKRLESLKQSLLHQAFTGKL